MKKTLCFLLTVCFLMSVTTLTASAKSIVFNDKIIVIMIVPGENVTKFLEHNYSKDIAMNIDNDMDMNSETGQIRAAKGMAIGNANGELKAAKGVA